MAYEKGRAWAGGWRLPAGIISLALRNVDPRTSAASSFGGSLRRHNYSSLYSVAAASAEMEVENPELSGGCAEKRNPADTGPNTFCMEDVRAKTGAYLESTDSI